MLRIFLIVFSGCSHMTASAQLLSNPGMEGTYTTSAPGWTPITYGTPAFPIVQYTKETANVHSGTAAQKITVTSLGDGATLLTQSHDFSAGSIYEGSVWLRSDNPIKVVFMFQERVPTYHVSAVVVKTIGPAWQQLRIKGGYGRDITTDNTTILGRFVIQPLEPGTLYIDDANLRDITDSMLNAPVTQADEVPAAFFGMHLNKLGVHQTWPLTQPGMLRLWNTGTEWQHIDAYQGALTDPANWIYDPNNNNGFRLDYYVNFIRSQDSTAGIIYTLGQTPSWSAGNVSSPLGNLAHWQHYVNIVGNRYKNKIRYWEPWNEVNFYNSWSGTVAQLSSLAQTAYQELKNIDPANKILTPNVASPEMLAHYLYAGGGSFADIISWHHYPSRKPEEMIPEIIGVKNVMENYNLAGMPLWNTEGVISIPSASSFLPEEDMAAVSRTLILQWTYGIRNFNWYAWDIYGSNNCNYGRLSISKTPSAYDSISTAGIAYLQTRLWLQGAKVVSKNVTGNNWTISLERPGGYKAWIVWNTAGQTSFTVPASWNVLQTRDLNGTTKTFSGTSVQLSTKPILLENSTKLSTAELEPSQSKCILTRLTQRYTSVYHPQFPGHAPSPSAIPPAWF